MVKVKRVKQKNVLVESKRKSLKLKVSTWILLIFCLVIFLVAIVVRLAYDKEIVNTEEVVVVHEKKVVVDSSIKSSLNTSTYNDSIINMMPQLINMMMVLVAVVGIGSVISAFFRSK